MWRYRRQAADPVIRWATLVLYVVSAFFFGLMVGPANPFVTAPGATQGLGPNSLLQDNPLVAIHPPLLYVGFVVFTVPFAFAIGMLATGRVGDRWQIECRRWTLVAFTFLSVGIVLGAWWSYQVLGWGGFWGWDPVENAALLPWLCGTAYLHSVLVQERRGLMRVWNLSLSIATFALTILGTFLTRSGVINSVHAFSESSLGPLLIGFFFAVVIVGFGLIAWRGDRLRSPGGHRRPARARGRVPPQQRRSSSASPSSSCSARCTRCSTRRVTQQQVTVGAPFFNTVAIPVGLTLLFLMAVAPVLSWRKMSGAVLWQRLAIPVWIGVGTVVLCVAFGLRGFATLIGFGLGAMAAATAARALVLSVRAAHTRHVGWWRGLVGRANGGMIVHLGVVVLAVGIIAATSYRHQAELALHRGEVVTYDGHRFEFEGLRTVTSPSRTSQEALVKVDGGVFTPATTSFGSALAGRGDAGHRLGALRRRLPDLRRRRRARATTSGNQAINNLPAGSVAIGVVIEPLVAWLWAGGLLIGVGGLLALVPGLAAPGHRPGLGRRRALVTERRSPASAARAGGRARAGRRAGRPRRRARHDRAPTPPPDPLGGGCRPRRPRRRRHRAGHPHAAGGHRRRQPAARARRPRLHRHRPEHRRAGLAGVAARPLRRRQLLRQLVHPVPAGGARPLALPLRAGTRADGADMVSVVFHDTTSTARAFLQNERRPVAGRRAIPAGRSPSATA